MFDRDDIVNAAVAGASHQQIARRYSCTFREIRQALDEFASEQLKPSARAAELALEVNRLNKLETIFMHYAIENRDATAGTLVCKLSQRKAALLGLDQPQAVRMDLAVVVEPEETSTENLRRVFNELRRNELMMSPEERERAAQAAEDRARELRGEGPDPDQD